MPAHTTTPPIPLEKLTAVFIKMRVKRAAITKAFKDEDAAIVSQMDKIKEVLLQYCKDNGVNSGNTDGGQFIRSVKTKYWTSDWESMNAFILEHRVPEFYTKSLNQTNVRLFMEDNPDIIPPGLNVDAEYVMTVKQPTKKRGG